MLSVQVAERLPTDEEPEEDSRDTGDTEGRDTGGDTTGGDDTGSGDGGFEYKCGDLLSVAKIREITGYTDIKYDSEIPSSTPPYEYQKECKFQGTDPDDKLSMGSGGFATTCNPPPGHTTTAQMFESFTSKNEENLKGINWEIIEETNEIGKRTVVLKMGFAPTVIFLDDEIDCLVQVTYGALSEGIEVQDLIIISKKLAEEVEKNIK